MKCAGECVLKPGHLIYEIKALRGSDDRFHNR